MMKYGKWAATGSVVNGAIHIRQEKPCQDAVLFRAEKNFAVACVADGHGSGSCPYSDEGAEAAVEVAGGILRELLPNIIVEKDFRLPRLIEANWKSLVKEIHANKEREPAVEVPGQDDEGAPDPFPYMLYGTTLLAAIAAKDFIFALQIGDGNILMIDEDGARPVLAGLENVGEDTESLCLNDAWTHIRTQIIPWDGQSPAMLMLSTDGYANSFADSSGFYKAGTDFFKLWQEEGLDFISENLPGWLRQSSDKGSGDDIAMALLAFEKKGGTK